MPKKTNMYSRSVMQWNPFVGCKFDCTYCKPSFQAQAKRQKRRCMKCYNYEPHEHPERLGQQLPPTGYGQFIFTCASGDISFCSTGYLNEIVNRICREKDKTFLIQSKNPKTFERISWPKNVILGTTIETNKELDVYYDEVGRVSKAPSPIQRYMDFCGIKHPSKMVTVEPVLDFNIDPMLLMIKELRPCMVWIGYDTKKTGLPEPPIEKVKELYWELGRLGFNVMLKHIRQDAAI